MPLTTCWLLGSPLSLQAKLVSPRLEVMQSLHNDDVADMLMAIHTWL